MELLIIVDSDILIDHFNGIKEATKYLESISPLFRATTDINVMELFAGARNLIELRDIEQFLSKNLFNILPITSIASKSAVELYKKYRLSNGLSIPDALVVSIVLELNSTFVSRNIKHFSIYTRSEITKTALSLIKS